MKYTLQMFREQRAQQFVELLRLVTDVEMCYNRPQMSEIKNEPYRPSLPAEDWTFVRRHFSGYFRGLQPGKLPSRVHNGAIHMLAASRFDGYPCYAIARSELIPDVDHEDRKVDLFWLTLRDKKVHAIYDYDTASTEAAEDKRIFDGIVGADLAEEDDLEGLHSFISELRHEHQENIRLEALFPAYAYTKTYIEYMTSLGRIASEWFIPPHSN
ncbi:MAG TPA: hypothetical protein VIJ25_12900 [Methylococcales bacterium]